MQMCWRVPCRRAGGVGGRGGPAVPALHERQHRQPQGRRALHWCARPNVLQPAWACVYILQAACFSLQCVLTSRRLLAAFPSLIKQYICTFYMLTMVDCASM